MDPRHHTLIQEPTDRDVHKPRMTAAEAVAAGAARRAAEPKPKEDTKPSEFYVAHKECTRCHTTLRRRANSQCVQCEKRRDAERKREAQS